jgi:hypothetical protein
MWKGKKIEGEQLQRLYKMARVVAKKKEEGEGKEKRRRNNFD